ELVENKRVRLELDVQSRDRYGRLLAYVWVDVAAERGGPAEWTMINAELVRLGYAQVMTVPPNVRYQSLFLKLQRDAREAGGGRWKRVSAAHHRHDGVLRLRTLNLDNLSRRERDARRHGSPRRRRQQHRERHDRGLPALSRREHGAPRWRGGPSVVAGDV